VAAARETWLILGASSALGRAFARRAARAGARLILAGRDGVELTDSAADLRTRFGAEVEIVAFDATAYDGHDAVARQLATAERPNVLLAFATRPAQVELERAPAGVAGVFDVNLAGAAAMLLRLLPVLEQRRGARVLVLGSVAGDRGRQRDYVFGASKAGLHAFVSGYRNRLHRAGVSVTLVKAGPFDSAISFDRTDRRGIVSVEDVAEACWRAAKGRRHTVYSPSRWRWLMAVVRAMPEPVFKRLDL
jgi:short-subunit dehydrogenase